MAPAASAAPAPPAAVAIAKLGALPAVRNRRWRRQPAEMRSVFQGQAHLVDVIDKPQSGFAEAVAAIRAGLPEQGRDRRVLVLGLGPQAGATTLALNLALDAARSGLPSLLVDAGDGALALTRVFTPDAEAGLGEVLAGRLGLNGAIRKDEGTGLAFLPRIAAIATTEAGAIRTGLFAAARRFGPIVVDGGTLRPGGLVGGFAEAVDDIVLVLRGNRFGQGEFEVWRAALGPQAEKIRGLVLNAA